MKQHPCGRGPSWSAVAAATALEFLHFAMTVPREADKPSRRKNFTGSRIEITGARILEGELGDRGDYFVGLCLNVGRPTSEVNHIVQRVQRLFAARHGDFTDGHSSNFLEDDFHLRSGFYARARKLVDSPFQSIFPLEVEVQPLDVARIVDPDQDHAIVRIREGDD